MQARALTPIALALLVVVFVCLLFARPATTLPPDFTDSLVTDVPAPTALAFTPDGRMLVTSKSGQLWAYENGQKTQALDIDSDVCSNSERGLLGVAVDPDFGPTGNNYVYLYYTFNKHGACPQDKPARNDNPVNRVARYVLSDANVATFDKVLIDNIPSPNGNHNAGDLKFGKDEYLYISVGDGGCNYKKPSRCQYENAASRHRNVLLGKILRITPDGDIPPDNPFIDPEDSRRCNVDGRTVRGKDCRETFVRGFRNPFRIAFDPDADATSFRINDVGGQRWEEIDQAQSGADYGWNLCEGRHDNPERRGRVNCDGSRYTGPIHEYNHDTGCQSITGGAFVPDGSWPTSYDDAYLFSDFVCGKIFSLTPDGGGGFNREQFADVPGGPVAMTFGPYQTGEALYYTTFAGGGQVRRIAYTGP